MVLPPVLQPSSLVFIFGIVESRVEFLLALPPAFLLSLLFNLLLALGVSDLLLHVPLVIIRLHGLFLSIVELIPHVA